MPVFPKGLLCSSGGGGGGSRSDQRRPGGCLGRSEEDDDDDSSSEVGGRRPAMRDRHNAELETRHSNGVLEGNGKSGDEDDGDDFKFFLTLSQPAAAASGAPDCAVESAALEFEHADADEAPPPPPQSQPQRPSKKPVKRAARSSCGRATSAEEEPMSEEEAAVVAAPLAGEAREEKFLVLLTGLVAHGPAPPDDFRFFLTVHQAEAAT